MSKPVECPTCGLLVVEFAEREAKNEESREPVERGPLIVDPDQRTLRIGERVHNLPNQQFELMYLLAEKSEKVVRYAQLIQNLEENSPHDRGYDHPYRDPNGMVAMYACKLNRLLRPQACLVNYVGVGYRLFYDGTGPRRKSRSDARRTRLREALV